MLVNDVKVPVLGFVAQSGTGKTTLLLALLPLLRARGLRVGLVKHAHHTFEIDHAGKDSYELRRSGAVQVVVGSRSRWALIVENEPPMREPHLAELLARLRQDELDLVLVEGFKHEPYPKIELHRPSLGQPLLFPLDPSIIAIAHDGVLATDTTLPRLNINGAHGIADFIEAEILHLERP